MRLSQMSTLKSKSMKNLYKIVVSFKVITKIKHMFQLTIKLHKVKTKEVSLREFPFRS